MYRNSAFILSDATKHTADAISYSSIIALLAIFLELRIIKTIRKAKVLLKSDRDVHNVFVLCLSDW